MTRDEELGMAWWNRITEREREEWLRRANSAMPADAWAEFKNAMARTDVVADCPDCGKTIPVVFDVVERYETHPNARGFGWPCPSSGRPIEKILHVQ